MNAPDQMDLLLLHVKDGRTTEAALCAYALGSFFMFSEVRPSAGELSDFFFVLHRILEDQAKKAGEL